VKGPVLSVILLSLATSVGARDALGAFDSWGAFRDPTPLHCFAIAEPVGPSVEKWRPFASVAHWPDKNVRSQLHVRLSHERRAGAAVILTVDDRRWALVSGKYDAWAPTSAHDAYIIAKIRAGRSMSVSSVGVNGGAFADTYRLKGAATAIDAAALGCAKSR
jgi:hypothetical protein